MADKLPGKYLARRKFLKTLGAAAVGATSAIVAFNEAAAFTKTGIPRPIHAAAAISNLYPLAAATFFLSPNGNDSNNGSDSAPWQNLSFALTKLAPGDTLVCAGAFNLSGSPYQYATTTQAGMQDKPITLIASSPGAAVFDGSKSIGHFLTLDHPFWVIEGLEIMRFNLNGIQINANDCAVRKCIIHDYELNQSLFPQSSTTVGVHLKNGASNCAIEDCIIFNAPKGEAIYIGEASTGVPCRDNVVKRNRITYVWEGVDIKPGSSPNTIEANTIDNCGHFGINSPDGVYIQRNTVIRSGREGTKAGISVKGNSLVRANTVIRCPNSAIRIDNSKNIVEDNLIAGTGGFAIDNLGGDNSIQRNIILPRTEGD